MSKASVMTVRIPSELKHRIEIIAKNQGVSLNQLAMYMFAKEVSSFETGDKISQYWQGYNKTSLQADFDDVMARVQTNELPLWDKLVAEELPPTYPENKE